MHAGGGLDPNYFMPHGHCYLWRPEILWLHVLSDLGISLSYFLIPLTLIYFVRKRADLPFPRVFILFGAFILLCGTTHLLNIWVIWNPDYIFEGIIKLATAAVSIATLIVTILLLPQALALPSPAQLRETNEKLEKANAELARLYAQSKESGEAHLRAVVDNVLDGLITIDETGRVLTFNVACERIFGYQAEEVIGNNIRMLMPEPYHSEHDGYMEAYKQTGVARIIGTPGRELQGRRKDGTLFPMDVSISSFLVNGERRFSGIVRDITRAKQAEEARQKLLTRLTESNTELERFAYVASHDMQEPLRMVINFSQIVQEAYAERLDEEGREYLHIMSDSALRMRDMVQDLLDYARLGREQPVLTDVDLSLELTHVIENLHELIRESGAEIRGGELPVVRGHAVQLMRLMQNLIANAIKYQPPGNAPVVSIYAMASEDGWEISVTDNGLGIAEPFVSQVFEPFRRLHTWDAIKGTGLGLAICRKIVENHGGQIWVTSEPGKGSTFRFTLSASPQPQERDL